MRTTLTIDDDVSVLLERRLAESGETFKSLVNTLLRSALTRREREHEAVHPRRVETPVFHGGTLLVGDVTSTSELLALAEGEDFR